MAMRIITEILWHTRALNSMTASKRFPIGMIFGMIFGYDKGHGADTHYALCNA